MIKFNNDFLTAASGDTNIAYQCHRTFPTHNINGCCDIGATHISSINKQLIPNTIY